jgi:pilus assembly protein FimV
LPEVATSPEAVPLPEEKPAVPQPQQPVSAEASPEPAPKNDLTSLLLDPMNVGLLVGVMLVLGTAGYLLVRRRRMAAEAPFVTFRETLRQQETDESPEVGFGAGLERDDSDGFDTLAEMPPESDALSEAEVYLAYGRYDQARDAVVKALDQTPDRKDLRLKLMEILALLEDRAGFEVQAQLLYDLVDDPSDPIWQRALKMGREIAPAHALFSGAAPAVGVTETSIAEDEVDELGDLRLDADTQPEAAPWNKTQSQAEAAGAPLDFDSNRTADVEEDQSRRKDKEELEFDLQDAQETVDDLQFDLDENALDLAGTEKTTKNEAPRFGASQSKDDGLDGLDFDLSEFSDVDAPAGNVVDKEEAESFEGAAEDLDFSMREDVVSVRDRGAEVRAEAQLDRDVGLDMLDEVSTKLDLARAYLDMGDNDGARSLLGEVVEEGDSGQRRQAEELLKRIA